MTGKLRIFVLAVLALAAPAQAHAGDVVRIQLTATRAHVWGTNFAVENVHGEGRDKKGATLGHHGDELRIFVQITAVLDGVKTSPPP